MGEEVMARYFNETPPRPFKYCPNCRHSCGTTYRLFCRLTLRDKQRKSHCPKWEVKESLKDGKEVTTYAEFTHTQRPAPGVAEVEGAGCRHQVARQHLPDLPEEGLAGEGQRGED